jgi:SAM-dependent methyltransferase
MTSTYQSLLSDAYLRAVFDKEFQAFQNSVGEKALIARLEKWSSKGFQKETSAEGAFTSVFLEDTWGYRPSGKQKVGESFTCFPKFPVPGAGQNGGIGEADVALGYFEHKEIPATPQVLCEFKDVRSNLDAPQKRKGNNRSPVKQCADYLRESMKPLFGNEAIQPTWGVVTDMNEFRLYWRNTMPAQYQRFIINKGTTDEGVSLLANSEEGSFQRFLFIKLFQSENLLTTGGASDLLKLITAQRYQEKEIENTFYREYRAFREHLVNVLIKQNGEFPGTKGKLVRMAQKLIDRCIFVMFCEDMGEQLSFPPNALRDYLAELSKSSTFEPDEEDAWNKLKELFHAMNEGKKFRSRELNRFNGGLFAHDDELEQLQIPNSVFCQKLQGENDETVDLHKLTLLYFAASYNFGTVKKNGNAITLFTLGRIFEQSITELEALEAIADQKLSLTIISRRKRDGVYYTPEWIVERVVAETLTARLDDIRRECGWSLTIEGDEDLIKAQIKLPPSKRSAQFLKHADGVLKFRDRLDKLTVLDPACGSGAFLIYTLEFLLRESRRVQRELTLVSDTKNAALFDFKPDEAIRNILSRNIFGVDINPASVEIARLALWLHTAKSDQPLTNLDANIVTGNSLVGKDIYTFKADLLGASQITQETLNAFDYEKAFPEIFDEKRADGRGFDCIVGNPPYVKLQNFKRVYPDTADYLREAVGAGGQKLYKSCQTGAFDLYLPFIEHGLFLLNKRGRLGFIAPSVWRFNEYGAGLRRLIKETRSLERWIDFVSFQVFEEATTYTALQFYSKVQADHIQFAFAPDGALADIPDWDDLNWRANYDELSHSEPWTFASRSTLNLIGKLRENCARLDDDKLTNSISQGIISGAFSIFANQRLGDNIYLSRSKLTPGEVKLEDEIVRVLISASDIDRFIVYPPSYGIIFPYEFKSGRPLLMNEKEFKGNYPNAWSYLKKNEAELRKRDAGQFASDGDESDRWYAYSRNQNLDKQSLPKIVIAGTGTRIEAAMDEEGTYAANDKRVYSIFLKDLNDLKFLTGILNSRVISFVFRHIARPKDNGYFDIETQFLAPLPIPKSKKSDKEKLSSMVDRLCTAYAKQAELAEDVKHRLAACSVDEKPFNWLWPKRVESVDALLVRAPSELTGRAKARWARAEQIDQVKEQVDRLSEMLPPGSVLKYSLRKGELSLSANGQVVLDGIFIDDNEAKFSAISWAHFLRYHREPDAESLVEGLRRIYKTENDALRDQMAALESEISALDQNIAKAEDLLNEMVFDLYELDESERKLVISES